MECWVKLSWPKRRVSAKSAFVWTVIVYHFLRTFYRDSIMRCQLLKIGIVHVRVTIHVYSWSCGMVWCEFELYTDLLLCQHVDNVNDVICIVVYRGFYKFTLIAGIVGSKPVEGSTIPVRFCVELRWLHYWDAWLAPPYTRSSPRSYGSCWQYYQFPVVVCLVKIRVLRIKYTSGVSPVLNTLMNVRFISVRMSVSILKFCISDKLKISPQCDIYRCTLLYSFESAKCPGTECRTA